MNNPFSLENKTILVTGASSGIGRSIAIETAKMGASVIITGRDANRLDATFKMLEGDRNLQVIADLNDESSLNNLVEQIHKLDGVVHCAGIGKIAPFVFATPNMFKTLLDINLFAPAELSRLLLQNRKIKKEGSIVFISSIAGTKIASIGNSIYGTTKGAINALAKGMALELANKQIRVNTIMPGMIDTDLLKVGIITDDQFLEDVKKYPLKRYGKPEEVAYMTIYLLSDASKWVTGSEFIIDGGFTLQ